MITNDQGTYDKVTKTMTIQCSSTLSQQGDNGEADQSFDITLKNECWDATVNAVTFADTTPSKELWASHTMDFSAMTSSLPDTQCGAFSYTLVGLDIEAGIYAIDGTSVVGQPTSIDPWVDNSPYTFRIVSQQGNYLTSTSVDISLTIVNPCLTTDVTPQAIADITTSVLGAADSATFTDFLDSVDTTYSSFPTVCGAKEYRVVTIADSVVSTPSYMSLTDRTLTLTPVYGDPVGTNTVYVEVKLIDYPLRVYYQPFNAVITLCEGTIDFVPSILDFNYKLETVI